MVLPLDHIGIGVVVLVVSNIPTIHYNGFIHLGAVGPQVPITEQDQEEQNNCPIIEPRLMPVIFKTFRKVFMMTSLMEWQIVPDSGFDHS